VTGSRRPAAYLRPVPGADQDLARQHGAAAESARQRGWPAPAVYADDDPAGQGTTALARLEAAIEAGQHDALLITGPAAVTSPVARLRRLLTRCTRNGVVVALVFPARPPAYWPAASPASTETAPALIELSAQETREVLAKARQEALSGLFPGWRIWPDQRGWHARRRQPRYLQVRTSGAPAYCVHARTAAGLAVQLHWQQATDKDAFQGSPAR
jgi:hypothetical protein